MQRHTTLHLMKREVNEIDGDRLFVNIVEYTTTTPEERFWEATLKIYLDDPM